MTLEEVQRYTPRHQRTKFFRHGDIVRFSDESRKYTGEDETLTMKVIEYDVDNWCMVEYYDGHVDGHPDRIMELFKEADHFTDDLFTL